MPNSWIFQANPKYYDIDNAIKSLNEIPWRVSGFINYIKKGDRVFIWKSGEDGGIIAIGTIQTNICNISFNEEELKFAIERDLYMFKSNRRGVRVSIDNVLNIPITKSYLKKHEILSRLSVIRSAQGTNFKLEPEEIKALDSLI